MSPGLWELENLQLLRTPSEILREQAEALFPQTNGTLQGEVRRDGNLVSLYVVAPLLNHYRFLVATFHSRVDEPYPAVLIESPEWQPSLIPGTFDNAPRATGEREFIDLLKSILQSRRVKTALMSMIQESKN